MANESVTFHRDPHDKDHPYLMVTRALLRDQSISPECRWLICYLLANTEGYTINIRQVINHLSPKEVGKTNWCGKDKVYALVNEAIEAGYISREVITSSASNGGGLKRTRYLVAESPKFKKFHRRPENQDAGDQDAGLTDNKNSNPKNKQLKEEEEGGGKPPNPPPAPMFSEGNVRMPEHLHEKLVAEFGASLISKMVQKLDDYSYTNPKRFKGYGCHSRIIRKWIRDDMEKEPSKASAQKGTSSAPVNKLDIIPLIRRLEAMGYVCDPRGYKRVDIQSPNGYPGPTFSTEDPEKIEAFVVKMEKQVEENKRREMK